MGSITRRRVMGIPLILILAIVGWFLYKRMR